MSEIKELQKNILKLIGSFSYDAYIEATFHVEKGSLWDIQQRWICPEGERTRTVGVLAEELEKHHPVKVLKTTKSVFKGDKDVAALLKRDGIQGVHIVGVDTNDCVLATAYESFDLGFASYVIEESCQSSLSDALHNDGLTLLCHQNMTNNSCIEKIDFVQI